MIQITKLRTVDGLVNINISIMPGYLNYMHVYPMNYYKTVIIFTEYDESMRNNQ